MIASKAREMAAEIRLVFAGRSNPLDSVLPPLLFTLFNAWLGFEFAMWSSVAIAAIISLFRLRRRQPLWYALGGLLGVGLAIGLVRLLGRAEGYFLPGIVSGALTTLLCLVSVLSGRPLVAWTSFLARRWPLAWYWHPRVRPAYSEVTWLWTAYFGLRLFLQATLFREAAAGALATAALLLGWPATVVLLIASYLYGTWRLRALKGPSVEEFKAGAVSPWQGQRRGF
jgi:hypothetical protein